VTENSDLWWGLRGAGHSFGIVSSLTMKIYPQINGGQHWMSTLIFTPDKIETVVEAINKLDWSQGMAVHCFFMAAPPDFKVCGSLTGKGTFASINNQLASCCSLTLVPWP
jgi:hypothetical protein